MPRRKQAWMGWGAPMSRVAGWDFDHRLNGYITTAADKFSCDCGEEFSTPSGYRKCGSCGRAWNSYVIGTDGHGKEASLEKVICREIPVRKDVIVASKRRRAASEDEARFPHLYCTNGCGNIKGAPAQDWSMSKGIPFDMKNKWQFYYERGDMHPEDYGDNIPAHWDSFGSWTGSGFCPDCHPYRNGHPHPESPGYNKWLRDTKESELPPMGSWDPDKKQDPFDPRLLGASRRRRRASGEPIVGKPADSDYFLDRGDLSAAWTLHKEKQHGKPLSEFSDDDWAIAGQPPKRKARRLQAKGKCQCWDGYERVPGTEPCAKGSCRKCDSTREAMRYVAWCRLVGRKPNPAGLRRFRTADRIVRNADRHNLRRRDLRELELDDQPQEEEVSIHHFSRRRVGKSQECADCGYPADFHNAQGWNIPCKGFVPQDWDPDKDINHKDPRVRGAKRRRRAELFDITDEGETKKGKGKTDTPKMRQNPKDWAGRRQNGQYTNRWN